MQKVSCYDKNGNTIDNLVQWDKNQVIYIDDLENGMLPRVHFALGSNAKESKEYKDNVEASGERIKIIIPNELLKTSTTMYVFLYYGDVDDEDSFTTKYIVILPITKKPLPDDYIYEDNVDFLSLYKINKDLNLLKETVEQDELIMQEHINNTENPHSIAYTEAENLSTLSSEETLSVTFGKLAKTVSSYIEHFNDDVRHITSEERENWNDADSKKHTHENKSVLDTTTASYTTEEQTKLSEISENAEVNQNAFSNVQVGETAISAELKEDIISIESGENIDITPDVENKKITISSSHSSIDVSSDSVSAVTLLAGETFSVVDDVTRDDNGHVTSIDTKSVTLPSTSIEVMQGATESENGVSGAVPTPSAGEQDSVLTGSGLWKELVNLIYPVGSIYMSVNDVSPESFMGGTWERFANGQVLVGVDENDTDFNASGKTGGEKSHVLSADEMPSHSHTVNAHSHNISSLSGKALSNGDHKHIVDAHTHVVPAIACSVENDGDHSHQVYTRNGQFTAGDSGKASINVNTTAGNSEGRTTVNGAHSHKVTFPGENTKSASPGTNTTGAHEHTLSINSGTTENASPGTTSTGGSTEHNNLQPYTTCYMWKRVA